MAAIQRLSGQEMVDVYSADHKKALAQERTAALKDQARDVMGATRDKGRAVTDEVSQRASRLGARMQGRSHDGPDERGPGQSA